MSSSIKIIIFIFLLKESHHYPQESQSKSKSTNAKTISSATTLTRNGVVSLGSCVVVLNRLCPDENVNFFLYTQRNPETPEYIRIGIDNYSNISSSAFNPNLPTKVIVHGYNSDMYLKALVEIKKQYLLRGKYNIFAVDWSPIAQGPCYPAAVWNTKFVGKCGAQLIERIRESGGTDIHIIGFSLGAHVAGFMSNNLTPRASRITGLDPAMPGFSTVTDSNKLDRDDGDFVDILHTNAFLQGVVQQSGNVDFYMNGGVVQPGCWVEERFFACNHHRAPYYFAESINSQIGFWGWPCDNYLQYLIGRCPPRDPQIIMGEDVAKNSDGMHIIITDSVPPFAVGKFTGPTIDIFLRNSILHKEEEETKCEHDRKKLEDYYRNYFDSHNIDDMFSNDFNHFNDTYFTDFDLFV